MTFSNFPEVELQILQDDTLIVKLELSGHSLLNRRDRLRHHSIVDELLVPHHSSDVLSLELEKPVEECLFCELRSLLGCDSYEYAPFTIFSLQRLLLFVEATSDEALNIIKFDYNLRS